LKIKEVEQTALPLGKNEIMEIEVIAINYD
jgi:hypothetical protein